MRPRRYTPTLAATAVVLAACLLAAGCTGQAPGGEDNATAPTAVLDGTAWNLLSYEQDGSMKSTLEGTMVTLAFTDNTTLSGSAGCNHYSARYTETGTAIAIGPAVSTLMYCETPGVMEQETAYLKLLGTAASFAVEGDTLTLSDINRTVILVFEKATPSGPAPLIGTTWTLESLYSGDTVSSVVAGSMITAIFGEDGSLTGSAGCNRYFATCTLSGASLSIGQIGSTKMHCTAEGIMEQETTYLNLLGDVKRYAIEGDRLDLLDESGVRALTFRAEA
ncbi:META domain-containing protein [Methanofollis tationis]|uniref:META domain-containing protein n=1 Tax=Methanofollis tationis TaxID=81417 RepID=A0A7K4HN16_9EURY|nr:META domain-containing protein [Methanofollis tationis]NVO66666.1 META domain-containing protein [Methanofollis tationis]